jgi:hypothetical protein
LSWNELHRMVGANCTNLFVNGKRVAEDQANGPIATEASHLIGCSYHRTKSFFTGTISEIAVCDTLLDRDELNTAISILMQNYAVQLLTGPGANQASNDENHLRERVAERLNITPGRRGSAGDKDHSDREILKNDRTPGQRFGITAVDGLEWSQAPNHQDAVADTSALELSVLQFQRELLCRRRWHDDRTFLSELPARGITGQGLEATFRERNCRDQAKKGIGAVMIIC